MHTIHQRLSLVIILLLCATTTQADQFDPYRKIIDCIGCYSYAQRMQAIKELEANPSSNTEHHYLLGMLYFIQAFQTAQKSARSRPEKPRIEEVMAEPVVRRLFEAAETNYNAVEKSSPGYKFLYCKYGELYMFWHRKDGLIKTTAMIGRAKPNERTRQCRAMLEGAAEIHAKRGSLGYAKAIYEEAVKTWKPYPTYMLEALGDIEHHQGDEKQAAYWWGRCVKEASAEARERCRSKWGEYRSQGADRQ